MFLSINLADPQGINNLNYGSLDFSVRWNTSVSRGVPWGAVGDRTIPVVIPSSFNQLNEAIDGDGELVTPLVAVAVNFVRLECVGLSQEEKRMDPVCMGDLGSRDFESREYRCMNHLIESAPDPDASRLPTISPYTFDLDGFGVTADGFNFVPIGSFEGSCDGFRAFGDQPEPAAGRMNILIEFSPR